jgi:3'(2'), 5'-bisphosphate nucleotidase
VAEESDPESFGGYRTSDRVFFVDPLDGTAEFIGRNGEFVVMIGLVEGDRAVAGVIVAPAKNTTWVGSLESGAWELTSAARRSIRVSDVQELGEARVVSSRSHRSDALERALALLGGQSLVPLGSAGLKGAAIADAVADVYVGTGHAGKRWDACAVDALVSSAGGRFSDMYGTQIDYRAPSLVNERGLVATNRSLHDRVLERLEPLRA